MKERSTGLSFAGLCSWFGISRQAYYQNKKQIEKSMIEQELTLAEIKSIRKIHKRIGGRKLHFKLAKFIKAHGIKMGRDALFDLLKANQLLIKQRKRYHITTNSNHWMKKYPNLIKDLIITGPNQVWVSDITYWKTKGRHYYISFVTDAYSRKIVGYHVAETMEAIESVAALNMALEQLSPDVTMLIHHSDRGAQYCSTEYVTVLKNSGIQISMTENGDPLENAIAERINGIIKGEYLVDCEINTLSQAKDFLKSVVKLYNEERPHSSLNNAAPSDVHDNKTDKEIKRLWKNYYKKNQSW
jgi:putative transposase